jgi:acyl-CoA thioesterase
LIGFRRGNKGEKVKVEQVGEATRELINKDPYAAYLGVEVLDIKPGWAKVGVKLNPDHLNFLGMVHGGVIFSLADVAFAAASNSFGSKAVALSVSIDFISAAVISDELIAEVGLVSRAGKTGNYEMKVLDSVGNTIALCHGWVYHTGRPHE